jgi:hypothetical protein
MIQCILEEGFDYKMEDIARSHLIAETVTKRLPASAEILVMGLASVWCYMEKRKGIAPDDWKWSPGSHEQIDCRTV